MTFVWVCLSNRVGRLNYIGSPGLQKGFHATHSSTLAQVKLDLDWVQLCSTSLQSHCFNQSQMSSMWTGAHKGKTLLIKMEWLAICIAIAYKLKMLIEDEDPFIIMLKRNKKMLHKLLLFWNAVWLKGVVLLICIREGLDRSAAAIDGNNYLDFFWNFSLRSLNRVESNWDSAQHQILQESAKWGGWGWCEGP